MEPERKSSERPTGIRVASMQVRGLSEAVELLGFGAASFIAQTGLDTARMADPQGWFSLEEFDALMVSATRLTKDPVFGLHWGERSPMMQFDLAPPLIASAPSLRSAVDAIMQLQPLLATRAEFRFSEQRERCVIHHDVLALTQQGIRTRSELVMAGLTRLMQYLGESDAIRRIDVTYPRPAEAAEYERVFGSLVHFDQPSAGFVFARAVLDKSHLHRNAELHQALRDRTEQQRLRALRQLSYAEQLEQQIRAALPRLLSIQEAARALNLSERSLRRRLAQEELSFSELVDRVQHRIAADLLALGTKSVKEIAYELGFSSVSGFHRAFRRWTGSSPARERAPRAKV
jgi:AraC-like DNA-binding protein